MIVLDGSGRRDLRLDCSATLHYTPSETPLELSIHNGQRILCLDGGGLKGLILIEVLIYIEKLTGKKIVDLFDWIVGTSTGGIIALALVYGESLQSLPHRNVFCTLQYDILLSVAKKSLQELKQLFFQLKDEVFGDSKMYGYGCNTSKLAEILKNYFGEKQKLSEITEPR